MLHQFLILSASSLILSALYQLAISALQTMLKQIGLIQEAFAVVPESVSSSV